MKKILKKKGLLILEKDDISNFALLDENETDAFLFDFMFKKYDNNDIEEIWNQTGKQLSSAIRYICALCENWDKWLRMNYDSKIASYIFYLPNQDYTKGPKLIINTENVRKLLKKESIFRNFYIARDYMIFCLLYDCDLFKEKYKVNILGKNYMEHLHLQFSQISDV